jgi:hypothetical protein
MTFQQHRDAIVHLGITMSQWLTHAPSEFEEAYAKNRWFTPEQINRACKAWAMQLTPESIDRFTARYTLQQHKPLRVAIIMAGNIPWVGLHDLLMVLMAGHKAIVKLSSDDEVLIKLVIHTLIQHTPEMSQYIEISPDKLPSDFDAVIATGSNNTNRYFEYYFRNKPALLRKNRNSIAVLSGNETQEQLQAIGNDIFSYYGMGCRNIAKLLVPQGYDFTPFFENIESLSSIIHHHKYANNYTYHKAIFLMNSTRHLDNGFLLVKQDERVASPLSVLFYHEYNDMQEVKDYLQTHSHEIQCVVSTIPELHAIEPSMAQCPSLSDFADGVDTFSFLQKLTDKSDHVIQQ